MAALLAERDGDFETAENYLLTSLRLNSDLGNQLNHAETSFELGTLYKLMNDNEKKKKYFSDALEYYKRINAAEEIKDIERLLKG